MSESSQRGKLFERKVQKMTSKLLQLEVKRDSRSGAGDTHKADVRDRFAEIPLFIECKDQEKANIKADWRKANGQASYGQAPVVVFPDNEEVLCTMRYSDLLQIIKESSDYRKSYELLRGSGVDISPGTEANFSQANGGGYVDAKLHTVPIDTQVRSMSSVRKNMQELVDKKKASGKVSECRAGHIADDYGFCMQKGCQYSRGYKPKKVKK